MRKRLAIVNRTAVARADCRRLILPQRLRECFPSVESMKFMVKIPTPTHSDFHGKKR